MQLRHLVPVVFALVLVACAQEPSRVTSVASPVRVSTAAAMPQVQPRLSSSTAAGTFRFERVIVSPSEKDWFPRNVMVRDVTGDGLADVVLSMDYFGSNGPQGWVRVRVHAGLPGGGLAAPVELDDRSALNAGHGLEVTDLDGDGRSEIIIGTRSGLTVFRRDNGSWTSKSYPRDGEARYLVSIDADADGHRDVFAQSWSSGADIFYGDGRGGFRSVAHVYSPSAGYNTVRTADFTGDGRDDVIVTNGQGWPKVWVHRFHPGTGLQAPTEFDLRPSQPRPLEGVTVTDVDHDGRQDLVTSDHGSDIDFKGVRIFYRGVGDSFQRVIELPVPGYYDRPEAVDVADIDGNGYPDIVVMIRSDGMGYFLQSATGFAPMVRLVTDDNPWSSGTNVNKSFEITDLDRDGCLDVVLAESTTSLRVFHGRGCTLPEPLMSRPLPPLVEP